MPTPTSTGMPTSEPPRPDPSGSFPVRTGGLAGELLRGTQELRASVISNIITKGLVGLGVGVGLAVFVFKRKAAPIMLTTGFGLGMGYSEGSQMVRDFHENLRRQALANPDMIPSKPHHYQVPPGFPHE